MHLRDEISAAIGAHGMWKTRLRAAIASGTSEFSAAQIGVDNGCVFGKWIHAVSDAQVKRSNGYRTCLKLHREFHAMAARVLALALAGRKAEAERAMAAGGEYTAASSALTRAMMEWKDKLQ
jgi:methyl-accepting chemotaxis protein